MRHIVAVASVAVLFSTGAGALWLAPDGWIIQTLIHRLEKDTGLHVDAHDIDVDWRGPSMHLHVGSFAVLGADGNLLLRARSLSCDVDARAMLVGTLAVRDLRVEEPHVTLTVVDGAVVGVPVPHKHGPRFFHVDVDRVHARGGFVEVTIPQQPHTDGADEGVIHRPSTVRVDGLDLHAAPDGGDEHQVRVAAESVAILRGDDVVWSGDPFAVEAWVGGKSLLDIDRLTFPHVELRQGSLDVVVDGLMNLPLTKHARRPPVDVSVHGSTTLAGIGPLADVHARFAGLLSFAGRAVSAKNGTLVIDGDASLHDLFVDKMALGSLAGHVHADGTDALVSHATWQLGGTVIHGQARGVLGGKLPFHVDATAERFSLYRLFRELHFSDGPWAEAMVTGDADGDGALIPFVLAGHANAVLDDVAVANQDVARASPKERVVDVAHRVRADVDFHADPTSLRLDRGTLDDGTTVATGSVELFANKARGLRVDVESSQLSLASIKDHIGPLSLSAHASGHLHVAGPYAHPRALASVHAQDLVVEGFALGDGDGRIDATSSTLKLEDVVLHKGASQYRSNLDIAFTHDKSAADHGPRLHLDVRLEGARADDLRAIIPRPESDAALAALRDVALTGPLAGDVHADGSVGDHTARHLTADAAFAAGPDARLYGMNVTGRRIHLRLDRGHLSLDGLH